MVTYNDDARQDATPHVNPRTEPDFSAYTYTVTDCVVEFSKAGMSLTERTVQRYCQSGKLRSVAVDPETRQPTEKENFVWLIDPASISERLALLREKSEFSSPTVFATSRDMTGHDTTGRDASRQPAEAVNNDNATASETLEKPSAMREEIDDLKTKLQTVEIDKRVRDQMVKQLQDDRVRMIEQYERATERIAAISEEKGRLAAKLEAALELPAGRVQDVGSVPDAPIVKNSQETDYSSFQI